MRDILLIADRPKWAYHNIAIFVLKNFSNKYNIYIDFYKFHLKEKKKYRTKIRSIYYNLREILEKFKYQNIRKDNKYDLVIYLGFYMKNEMLSNIYSKTKIVGIYTEGFPPQGSLGVNNLDDFKTKYLTNIDGIICGSYSLKEFYCRTYKNVFYVNASLNERMFDRRNYVSDNNEKEFVIGWTGNPNRKFKHFYDIIIPAVEKFMSNKVNIRFKTRFKGPMKTLPKFYLDVDVVIIASEGDAGPSLFLEAGLMDVPAISTKIGFASETIKHLENGYLLKNGTEEDIIEALNYIYDNKQILKKMKKQIRKDVINQLGESTNIERWQKVFSYFLN